MTSRKLVLIVCVLCVSAAFMVGQAKPPVTDAGGTEPASDAGKIGQLAKGGRGTHGSGPIARSNRCPGAGKDL